MSCFLRRAASNKLARTLLQIYILVRLLIQASLFAYVLRNPNSGYNEHRAERRDARTGFPRFKGCRRRLLLLELIQEVDLRGGTRTCWQIRMRIPRRALTHPFVLTGARTHPTRLHAAAGGRDRRTGGRVAVVLVVASLRRRSEPSSSHPHSCRHAGRSWTCCAVAAHLWRRLLLLRSRVAMSGHRSRRRTVKDADRRRVRRRCDLSAIVSGDRRRRAVARNGYVRPHTVRLLRRRRVRLHRRGSERGVLLLLALPTVHLVRSLILRHPARGKLSLRVRQECASIRKRADAYRAGSVG